MFHIQNNRFTNLQLSKFRFRKCVFVNLNPSSFFTNQQYLNMYICKFKDLFLCMNIHI